MATPSQETVTTNELVTGPPGLEMLHLSNLSQQTPIEALDLGCGGGIVTSQLIESTTNIKRIIAGDIDDQMLAIVTAKRDNQINNQTPSTSANTTNCPALAESHRVLKPSGQAGFTSWKSIAWWTAVVEPALAQHLPEAPKLPNPSGLFGASGWSDVDAIRIKLEKTGFGDVRVSEFSFAPMIKAGPFAKATAALVGGIAKRVWSEEEFGEFGGKIEAALLRYLEENFEKGVWDGEMTAIVALGIKQ